MKTRFLLTTACLALIAGAAQAADVLVTTAPGTTTTRTTTYYVDYDANHNGILDSNEFYTYAYKAWDMNHDGFLSPDEWQMQTPRWYGPKNVSYQTYTYWDKNGDGRVDSTEFDTVGAATNLYSVWDVNADNRIENDEYAAASFRLYDLNNDGVLSMDEWKNAL